MCWSTYIFLFFVFQRRPRMFCEVCSLPVFCVQHLWIYFYLSSSRIFTSEIWFVLMTANCKGIMLSSDKMYTRKFHWICFGCCKSAAVISEKLLILKYRVKHPCWACLKYNINIVDWMAVCIQPWKSPRIHYNEHKSLLFSWICIDHINRVYIVYYSCLCSH